MAEGGRRVLDGAFVLLEALASLDGRAGLAQLVRASGLPKTTVHRLLDQLAELGAVERAAEGYRTGSRVFRVGQSWQPELRQHARDWLPVLATRLRASLLLTVPRERRVLVVAGALVPGDGLVPVLPGTPLPPGTAAGRLLAAYALPVGEPGDAGRILADGFAAENGVVSPGFGCVAVPVRTPGGRVEAALAAVTPTPVSGPGPLSLVPGLVSAARAFGAALAAG